MKTSHMSWLLCGGHVCTDFTVVHILELHQFITINLGLGCQTQCRVCLNSQFFTSSMATV